MLKNRVVLCGPACSGKTSIFNQMKGVDFYDNYRKTMITSHSSVIYDNGGDLSEINVWDVTGDISLIEILKPYFQNVDVVIYVCDVTNNNAFTDLAIWMEQFADSTSIVFASGILVLNKIDLIESINNVIQNSQSYAQEHNLEVFRICAKDGNGLDALLKRCDEICKEKARERLSMVQLSNNVPHEEPKSKCC